MDALVTLNAFDLERLLITIESSQQVHQRHQYYLWSQGALQSFLPHDALIIGYGDFDSPEFRYEMLGRNPGAGERQSANDFDRLVRLMLESWQQGGHLPQSYRGAGDAGKSVNTVDQALRQLSFGHALAHGTREFTDATSGFFVFLNMPELPGRRHAYFADILLPYMHTALHRVLRSEKSSASQPARVNVRLSNRESQVIALIRDGKTNQQIAEVLCLSPLTIKNHVQNILGKLEVSNRAQAVAKAVKARLISDQPG